MRFGVYVAVVYLELFISGGVVINVNVCILGFGKFVCCGFWWGLCIEVISLCSSWGGGDWGVRVFWRFRVFRGGPSRWFSWLFGWAGRRGVVILWFTLAHGGCCGGD
jgi:hypothetical protein